jgi:hypothetical protein
MMPISLARRAIKKVSNVIPPRLAARIDLLDPAIAKGFGPFNGQETRQAIVGSVLHSYPFDLVIETGTYRGTTTEHLRKLTTAPIITIEVSTRYYEYARRRLSGLPDVRWIHGDSPSEIRRVAAWPTHDRQANVFAYLDAHWGLNLPIRWELLELLSGWDSVCAVIDDFKVPGDPGYGYDDYGSGHALDLAQLSGLPLEGVSLFFPQVPSDEETGHRRGWVVLGRGRELVEQLSRTDGLALADRSIGAAVSSVGEPD